MSNTNTEVSNDVLASKLERYEKEIERLRAMLFHFTGEMEKVEDLQ